MPGTLAVAGVASAAMPSGVTSEEPPVLRLLLLLLQLLARAEQGNDLHQIER